METKGRILVIEDNEQNLYLATFLLEKSGHEVIAARDGQEGIDKARQEQPNLIVLDMQLPIIDGYEVARRLKKMPECKAIPIVAVTSFAMVGDRERVLAAGCQGYIEKPVNPETFVEQIERHFRS